MSSANPDDPRVGAPALTDGSEAAAPALPGAPPGTTLDGPDPPGPSADRPHGGTPGGRDADRAAPPRKGTFSSLRHRNFAMFWAAAVLSNTGSTMQQVTVPFVIYELTKSTAWLGISAAIAFVPPVLLGPLGGALADRVSRRQVLLVCQSIMMVSAFGLWALWESGHAAVWSILLIVLVNGMAGGVSISSWQAFVPSLVPRDDLMNAVRLNSIQFTVARAGGPALAGLVLATLGPGAAFFGNAVSFIPVVVVLLLIPNQAAERPNSAHSIAKEFVDGLGYTRRHPSLFQCIVNIFVLATLAYAIIQLAPAVALDQLHVGKAGYGLLVATYGVGSIICSFFLAARGDRFARSTAAMVGFAIAVVGLLVLGVSTAFWLGAAAFFMIGVAQTVAAVSYNTAIQVQVNDAFRGRVLAVYLMAIQLGLPVGALALGTVATVTGTRWLALGCGFMLLGYFVFVMIGFKGMRAIDPNEQFAPEPAPDLTV
jgi:MFS family permease